MAKKLIKKQDGGQSSANTRYGKTNAFGKVKSISSDEYKDKELKYLNKKKPNIQQSQGKLDGKASEYTNISPRKNSTRNIFKVTTKSTMKKGGAIKKK
jgi:nitrogen fixation/metabolism regulation signal transduction histidine kinase